MPLPGPLRPASAGRGRGLGPGVWNYKGSGVFRNSSYDDIVTVRGYDTGTVMRKEDSTDTHTCCMMPHMSCNVRHPTYNSDVHRTVTNEIFESSWYLCPDNNKRHHTDRVINFHSTECLTTSAATPAKVRFQSKIAPGTANVLYPNSVFSRG